MFNIMKIVPWFAVLLGVMFLFSPDGLGDKFPRFDLFAQTSSSGKLLYNEEIFKLPLSHLGPGQHWSPTWGSLLILIGVFFLYLELYKATRTSELSVLDHTFSLIVFVFYFATFVTREWAGNDLFFIIMSMAFLDVAAGLTITISGARRDFNLGGG